MQNIHITITYNILTQFVYSIFLFKAKLFYRLEDFWYV